MTGLVAVAVVAARPLTALWLRICTPVRTDVDTTPSVWARHPTIRYAFAVGTTAATTVVSLAASPLVALRPSPPFLLSVLVVAWVAGRGPAVLACVLGLLAMEYFLLPPLYAINLSEPRDLLQALIFLAVGLTMAWLAATRRRSEARERQARADAERATRMIQRVQRVTETPLLQVSADRLMRDLLARIREALASDTATILLLAEDGGHLVPVSSDGRQELVPENDVRIPLGEGLGGRIAASPAGLAFPDVSQADVFSPFLRERVKSVVGVPLRVGDRLIGVIHVGSQTPHRFTDDDLALLRLVADRAALVIERLRVLEAERAARDAAEAANRAKDEFLALLSHELRSPLNAIAGWLNLLRARTTDAELTGRAFETIERNTRLLTTLVDDLLDVSQIVVGGLRMERQRVAMAPLVDGVLETMEPAAAKWGVALDRMVDASSGLVWGDPVRLHQAIGNVVANAIKFTAAGGSVEVRVQGAESEVKVTVSDTGQGIAPEFLPHVFDRFQQQDTSATRTHGGLGLGLAIVRHVVEAHGGTVSAESPGPGRGARFTIRLPVLKSEDAPRPPSLGPLLAPAPDARAAST